jgi:hypothetical protein
MVADRDARSRDPAQLALLLVQVLERLQAERKAAVGLAPATAGGIRPA